MKVSIVIASSPLSGANLIGANLSPAAPAATTTRVEFWIDDVLKSTDTSAPYSYNWDTVAYADSSHTIVVKAFYPRNKVAQNQVTVQTKNAVTPPQPPPPQAVPVNTELPTVSDTTPQEGQTINALVGTWTNSPTSYRYQWQRCDGAGANCVAIASATTSTYTCSATDVGSTLRCSVTALNGIGASELAQTAQTTAVSALAPAVPVLVAGGTPVISGTSVQGSMLSVSNGSWTNSPTSYTRQWQRGIASPSTLPVLDNFNRANAGPPPSASWTDASGMSGLVVTGNQLAASGTGYRSAYWNAATFGPDCLVFVDLAILPTTGGIELLLRTTNPGTLASLSGYELYLDAATSDMDINRWDGGVATRVGVTDTSQTFVSGDALAFSASGSILTAWRRSDGVWTAIFSRTDATYNAQSGALSIILSGTAWRLDNFGGGTLIYASIAGATASQYALVAADVGSTVRCQVTAVNVSGSSAAAPTAATSIVTSSTPAPPPGSSLPLRGLVMIDSVANFPTISATALRQNLIILHATTSTSILNQLKAANPACRVVPYQEWGMVSTSGTASALTLAQAQAGGFVANYNGSPAVPAGFPQYYGADCGKAGYGLAWAQAALTKLGSNAWNGTFMDDVNVADNRFPKPLPDGYASVTAYKNAIAVQLQAACDYFRTNGKITVANLGGLGTWSYEHMKDLQPYPDVSMAEHFGNWGGGSTQGEATWLEAIAAINNAVALGRQIMGIVHLTSLSDHQRAHYGDGLARVWANPGDLVVAIQPTYGDEYWHASFAVDYGAPTAPAQHPSTDIWTRGFANGTTLTVNAQTQITTP